MITEISYLDAFIVRLHHQSTTFFYNLDHTLHTLSLENKNVIIMGDININLLNDTSPTVISYTSLLQSYGYECLIDVPTRQVPSGTGTLIDHVLT